MLSMFKRDTPAPVEDPAVEPVEPVEQVEQVEQAEDPAVEQVEQVEQAEDLAAVLDATRRRLFAELVAADGRVSDPETIEYAAELVDDPAALAARITAELEARPGIGRHAAGGDVGAGITGAPAPADLIDAIRAAHNHNR